MSIEARMEAVSETLRETGATIAKIGERAVRLRTRIAALEHALRAYMHAHHTGDSVPLEIEREAVKLLEVAK